jgi:hypothetical protein
MFKLLSEIDLTSILAEAVLGAILNGILISVIGLFVYIKAQRALKAGKLEDIVVFSFNLIEKNAEGAWMRFRTPITGTLQDIFKNDHLISQIKKTAESTTEDRPIIQLPDQILNSLMKSQLVNYCNQINLNGQAALLAGLPVIEKKYQLALVYEPGAQKKIFRIIPVNQAMLDEIENLGPDLKFEVAYHSDRLKVLNTLRKELQNDLQRPYQDKVLTNFVVTIPQNENTMSIKS